jgi:hypothetical protein
VRTDGELSGRGTFMQFGVADRQEGAAVSVGLLADYCSVMFSEC